MPSALEASAPGPAIAGCVLLEAPAACKDVMKAAGEEADCAAVSALYDSCSAVMPVYILLEPACSDLAAAYQACAGKVEAGEQQQQPLGGARLASACRPACSLLLLLLFPALALRRADHPLSSSPPCREHRGVCDGQGEQGHPQAPQAR